MQFSFAALTAVREALTTVSSMPELPDITIYIEALEKRVLNKTLSRVRVASPFVLRTFSPPLASIENRPITELRRIGKRIAFGFTGEFWLVVHLMIAGRFHWRNAGIKLSGKQNLAAFDFSTGTLILSESAGKKRASIHLLLGEKALSEMDPQGLEIFECSEEQFAARLTQRNHTLKRALTDPHLFSGIGNAYSDEILHQAKLSPVTLTERLSREEIGRLFAATRNTMTEWIERLRRQAGDAFPEKVTAFRPEMAVHGKFGCPCPICGAKVQRIRYAETETNYCPVCQTGGKLLADRSLSLLLKKDWPKTPEELEELKKRT
jgi:formamidopyrimidine-DNA glycosylase